MKITHTCELINGETIFFKTDMPKESIKSLPAFLNQHKFNSYFKSNGYSLEIVTITKTL